MLVALIVIVRLVYIQFFSPTFASYADRLSQRIISTKPLKAVRGEILMRDGEPLATALTLYQVKFDFGSEALDSTAQYNYLSDSLAGLLGRYFAAEGYGKSHFKQVLNRYHDYRRGKGLRTVMLLPRPVDYSEWCELKEFTLLNWDVGMCYQRVDTNMRVYPLGDIAKRTVGKRVSDRIKTPFGIEHVFDSILRGEDGVQIRQRVAHGYTANVAKNDTIPNRPKIDGADIVTTLDRRIQEIADVALRKNMVANNAIWGTAIVMSVETGEILAMCSYPTYNLATFSEDFATLNSDTRSPFLNREQCLQAYVSRLDL